VTTHIEIATTPTRVVELRAPWHSLWERGGAEVFQRHEWISGWVRGLSGRTDTRPMIGLAWEGDRLVAVLPCAVRRRDGLRTLEWAAQELTDYCDALVDPAVPGPATLERVWGALHSSGGFDLVHLRQVRPDSQARFLLDGIVRQSGRLRLQENQERCLRIDSAWPNGEAWFRSLNKKARNNHTRGKRILAELGGDVVFRMHDPATPIGPLLQDIFALKRAWLRTNHPGSPFLGADANLPLAVLEAVWATGQMAVFLLECGGRIAAASVNFIHGKRMQAYLTAYDPVFDRASPGTILIVDYTKWAFDHGLELVDFLRGEEPFKFRLANAETRLDGYLGGRTLIGRAAIAARDLRDMIRPKGAQVVLSDDDPSPDQQAVVLTRSAR
jgi:CelD/BcsL family acetyltransferase involved in cellulose biosynthesis